jgi:hypothetical protein
MPCELLAVFVYVNELELLKIGYIGLAARLGSNLFNCFSFSYSRGNSHVTCVPNLFGD